MKTGSAEQTQGPAAIVRLVQREVPSSPDADGAMLERARAFTEALLVGRTLDTGEGVRQHADGVAEILDGIGAAPSMRAAAYLVYAADFLANPEEVVAKSFGASFARLVQNTRQLVQIQRAARRASVTEEQQSQQVERVRKMLLAFSRDLRVVLLRLASRLQTLRFYARTKSVSGGHRPRIAAGVRAAGEPARHLADQVGDRGPRIPLPQPEEYRPWPVCSTSGASSENSA